MRYLPLLFICCLTGVQAEPDPVQENRSQKHALIQAHKILPEQFRYLVRKHARHLFQGLDAGLQVSPETVDEALILKETQRITDYVDQHAHFSRVVHQMGYVAGLFAVFSDPTHGAEASVRKGFPFYLESKLPRFHFVFDGYSGQKITRDWLTQQLKQVGVQRHIQRDVLSKKYSAVGHNSTHMFSEKSAVFGISSIYYSNMARISAHLWYYAWASARGDQTRTPFVKQAK